MKQIVTEPTVAAHWQALVQESAEQACLTLDETLESYLVFTLMRFTERPDLVHNIMAMQFLNGLNEQGMRRHDELRDVGDQCLLISGLFPHNAKRRLVRISYFVDLGKSAYMQIHEDQQHAASNLYGKLAHGFVPMMDVLLAMRPQHINDATGLFDAIELWEKTGSSQAKHTIDQHTNSNTPTIINSNSSAHH